MAGETGSGKSELCQWLEYNLADGIHVPIHFSRSMNKLQDIVKLIDDKLLDVPRTSDQYGDLTGIPSDDLAFFLLSGILVNLPNYNRNFASDGHRLRELIKSDISKDNTLRNMISAQIQKYKESRILSDSKTSTTIIKERPLLVIERDWFTRLPMLKSFDNSDVAFEFVTHTLNETIKKHINLGNISEKLRKISDKYRKTGQRPVLILEDLTSFSVLAEDLIDFIFDLPWMWSKCSL